MNLWSSLVSILAAASIVLTGLPTCLAMGEDINYQTNTLLLVRVAPSTPLEFITVQNVSNRTIDACGWSISDGEGWVRVNATIVLHPGDRLSLCTETASFNSYYPDEIAIGYRDRHAIRHGTFALADKGDQVDITDPRGNIIDSFCFGSATPSSGWSGTPLTPLPKGDMAARNLALPDTGTSSDWYRSCVGRSELQTTSYQASVDPFTSPEGALSRMIREIEMAQTSIHACVYELGNPVMTKLFYNAEIRGVEVNLLLEGQPVAGLTNSSKTAISTLVDAGCDVRMIVSNQSYRRYDCLHAKYFVIDGERVTVMSENWGSGLISNRGWGVTVISKELAQDMLEMFHDDSSLDKRDVKEASAVVRDWYNPPEEVTVPTLKIPTMNEMIAGVTLIASPDTSFQGTLDLISSASERLLVEQLDIDPAWVGKNKIMAELVSAADRGVQVRVLLDQTFVDASDGRNNNMTVNMLNALAKEHNVDLQARLVSDHHDFGIMHNKGVIADDRVLVSSINWGDASMFQNREVGLVLSSASVSSFFADFFWNDWSVDPNPPIISLSWQNITIFEGQPIVLDARESFDRAGISTFIWTDSLSGGTWNGSYLMVYLGLGVHKITLQVTDRYDNTATETILVIVQPQSYAEDPNYLIMLPAGVIGTACCLWTILRKLKKR
jgi:cardiolipin synthase A/B